MASHSRDNGAEIYRKHKNTFIEKQDKEWYEDMLDYYVDLGKNLNDKNVTRNSLDASKGIIPKDAFDEVLNQINDKNMELKIEELNILDDVDIITPIKERYMGEFIKTPNFYTVTVQSEDIVLGVKAKVQESIFNVLIAKLQIKLKTMMNQMKQQNLPEEEVQKQIENINIKEEVERIKQEYFEKEASKAKQIVEFFSAEARLEEKFMQLFYYFFATEEVYVKFDPKVNHLDMEIINPVDYYRIPTRNNIFVEDDEAGIIIYRKSIKDILDEFGDELTKDDITYLESLLGRVEDTILTIPVNMIESRYVSNTAMFSNIKQKLGTNKESVFANNINAVDTYEIYFKTKRRVGRLRYYDINGVSQTRLVGDTYELDVENGDIELEWYWEDEIWKGYRFGGESGNGAGVYIKPKPILVQRDELSILNSAKLPIVGVGSLLYEFGRKPIPARMLSHQAFYIILTNKYRNEMAKFHGFVNLIAESILSDSDEFSQKSRLEYMFKDNLLIFNDAEVDVNILQALRTIGNEGQASYIQTIGQMRDAIKAEAWDLANMNAERFGQIDVKGGMGNTQEAIRRVSTGSTLLFTMFDMFKERVYQAISDYGRIVYIDGIKTDFMDKNKNVIELDVNHEELISSEMGIHFTTNYLEREKLDMIRNAVVSNSVQTGNTLDAINALNENDLESLKVHAEKLQKLKEQREEQMAKQEQDAKKYIEDKKQEVEAAKLQGDINVEDIKGKYDLLKKDKDIYIKMLELKAAADLAASGNDANGNGIPDNYANTTEFDRDLQYLESEIKRQQIELNKYKIKNEKEGKTTSKSQ
jgi:hypothetical protein